MYSYKKDPWIKILLIVGMASLVIAAFGHIKKPTPTTQNIDIETISGDHNTFNFNNGGK